MSNHDHYFIDVSKYDRVDIYRLIDLLGITCPVAQHVFKKAAATGKRGHKSLERDWADIADSAARRLQMMAEDAKPEKPSAHKPDFFGPESGGFAGFQPGDLNYLSGKSGGIAYCSASDELAARHAFEESASFDPVYRQ